MFTDHTFPIRLKIKQAKQDRVYIMKGNRNCTPYALLILRGCSAKWLLISVESTFVHDLNDLISTAFNLIIWSVNHWTWCESSMT